MKTFRKISTSNSAALKNTAMKSTKAPKTAPRQTSRRILSGSIAAACVVASLMSAQPAKAASLYWDVNGVTAGFSRINGAWDGTNAFWNDQITGTGGTPQAGTTNADDLFISGGTTGAITLSGARTASSLTLGVNVAFSLVGGTGASLTIGGTGASSGIFVAPGDNAYNLISTALILANGTSTIQNGGTGILISGRFCPTHRATA